MEAGKGRGGKPGPWTRADSLFLSSPCPQESISSSGTPHKRDSFIYSTWLEDSVSTTSGGSSPGTRAGPASPTKQCHSWGWRGQGWAQRLKPLPVPQVVGV